MDIVKFIENFCMRIGIYVELGMVECVFDWWNDNCKLNNEYWLVSGDVSFIFFCIFCFSSGFVFVDFMSVVVLIMKKNFLKI